MGFYRYRKRAIFSVRGRRMGRFGKLIGPIQSAVVRSEVE
jgi:hypothetical protein